MSIVSVDNIQPIGSGTTVTVNKSVTLESGNTNITGVCTATSFSGSGANLTGVLSNIVEDTSPQLGGNLDCNNKNISLNDSTGGTNNRIKIGTHDDLHLWHNSSTGNSNISNYNGNLYLQGNNGSGTGVNQIAIMSNAAVELNYQGNKKLETTNTGAVVTGICTATTFEATTFSKTPTNTPAFHAYRNGSSSPTISDQTITKITLLTTETLDTDNAYDNSSSGTTANRFTVPSGKGGYYQVAAGLNFYADSNDMKHARVMIYKNGSVAMTAYGFVSSYAAGTRHLQCDIAGMLNLNASDYLEVYAYLDVNGGSGGYISNDSQGLRGNYFSAFKLII